MYLLQISGDDWSLALIYAVAFIIAVAITRWIFGINTMIKLQKQQTRLLAKIAKYSDVPVEEINEVLEIKQN